MLKHMISELDQLRHYHDDGDTSAFCGEVSLASTVGGVHATLLMSPAVARAVAQELLACAEAIDP